jgi:hypothetical protein
MKSRSPTRNSPRPRISTRRAPKRRKQAIASALSIGADQVAGGKPYFGALVSLREGNKDLIQFVVSLGASPLKSDG